MPVGTVSLTGDGNQSRLSADAGSRGAQLKQLIETELLQNLALQNLFVGYLPNFTTVIFKCCAIALVFIPYVYQRTLNNISMNTGPSPKEEH